MKASGIVARPERFGGGLREHEPARSCFAMSTSAQAFGPLAFAALALSIGSTAQSRSLDQTQCDPRQLGRELSGDPIPEVPLLGGIRTGMTRAEVKRLAPKLSFSEGRQKLDLFPGLSFRATAAFHNFFGGIETLTLHGRSSDAPIEPLTQHYGAPIKLEDATIQVRPPGLGADVSGFVRTRVLKWCDGQRVLVMRENPDSFALTVTAERLRR